MKTRFALSLLGFCVLSALCLILRPMLAPAAAQTPAPAAAGRYQLTFSPSGAMYLLDTATGRLWHYVPASVYLNKDQTFKNTLGYWVDMDSPVSRVK